MAQDSARFEWRESRCEQTLGASYGTSSLTTTMTTTIGEGNQRRITQAKDDPLPRHLEADIVVMKHLVV
jgi:hypothetical protein